MSTTFLDEKGKKKNIYFNHTYPQHPSTRPCFIPPEAAIVAIKPPGSDADASDNKKEKKDKKDKKDKAEKADDAPAASSKGDP